MVFLLVGAEVEGLSYKNAREKLLDNMVEIEEDMILLEEDIFIDSLVGVSSDLRAVYDYDLMVEEYVRRTGCSTDDAIDYVDQGIVRWVGYYTGKAPVILDSFIFDGSEENADRG